MARRRTRRKRTRSRRKSRRKSSRRKRKSRKSRRKSRRKRQRGGNRVKVNAFNNKVMEPPMSTNNNWNVPRNPTQKGGRKRRRTRRRKRQRGGGSILRAIGLGDVLQGYYSATDFTSDTKNKWAGNKKEVSSKPIRQPRMMKSSQSQYKLPNVPEYHRVSSAKAAKHMLKS